MEERDEEKKRDFVDEEKKEVLVVHGDINNPLILYYFDQQHWKYFICKNLPIDFFYWL